VAVRVLVPGLLASQAGGKKEFEVEGATLGDALRDLPLRDLLFDESGTLRPLVNVYVDRQDMRMRDGLDTALQGDEEIRIVAAIAGGRA
jgi:molybdopterin converting factor small subunit